MNSFRSHLHDIYTEMRNKVALSHHDDKRFVIPNTTKTLPWGHSDIRLFQSEPEQNVMRLISALNSIVERGVVKKNIDKLDVLLAAMDELGQ